MISVAAGRLVLHTGLDDPLYVSPRDIVGISEGETNPKFSHLIIRHFGVLEVQETVEDILEAISKFRANRRIEKFRAKKDELDRTLEVYTKFVQQMMSDFDERNVLRDKKREDEAESMTKNLLKQFSKGDFAPLSVQSFEGFPEPPKPGGKDVINDMGVNLINEEDDID